MISDFLLKNIDNFFNEKANLRDPKPFFNQQTIKRDLSTVIRSKRDISQTRKQAPIEKQENITKSRLKTQLEQNKQLIVEEIVKRTNMIKSKSSNKIGYRPVPYNYNEQEKEKEDVQYQYKNNWRDVSPKKEQIPMQRTASRNNLMNKYKDNTQNQYSNPYMPSKDHAIRERQCRLPIKGYSKYQF